VARTISHGVVTVCCRALQCVAVRHKETLRHGGVTVDVVRCSTLQCVAVARVLPHDAVSSDKCALQCSAVRYNHARAPLALWPLKRSLHYVKRALHSTRTLYSLVVTTTPPCHIGSRATAWRCNRLSPCATVCCSVSLRLTLPHSALSPLLQCIAVALALLHGAATSGNVCVAVRLGVVQCVAVCCSGFCATT